MVLLYTLKTSILFVGNVGFVGLTSIIDEIKRLLIEIPSNTWICEVDL